MSEELSFGFMLMATGMITVFTILALVVGGGKLMILLLNRFGSDGTIPPIQNQSELISGGQVAAISAAVNMVTGGTGKITDIEKKK